MTPTRHPDFEALTESWDLSLRADGYAHNTIRSYRGAVDSLAAWLADNHPGIGPTDLTREHVRGWLVQARDTKSASTARSWFPGVRHFTRWLIAEEEAETDPTDGIKTPTAGEPDTPVLSEDNVRRLLKTCEGKGFVPRRDAAIIRLFADAGLRLAELTGLGVGDVDLRDRIVFVEGKGSRRSGPRRRAVPFGIKTAQALDRYMRERRKHPRAASDRLWLGDRGRAGMSTSGVKMVLKRRAAAVGIEGLHPHMLRHTWASEARKAGLSEGDLMVLGGWRNRAMLDRYGRAAAADRAREAYERLSFGDRL